MMKHRNYKRCDAKLLGSARASRACFGALAETPHLGRCDEITE
jgi:hypothetical protein